jgi:ubiquinone/menaquinone biosynthesis C-methylase UbiE
MDERPRPRLYKSEIVTALYDVFDFIVRFGHEDPRAEVASEFLGVEGAVLDVAAGTAMSSLRIAATRPDLAVVTLDRRKGLVAVLAQKQRTRGIPNLTVVHGDPLALPFRTGAFGGVTMSYALHELAPDDRERALDELARVAAPGAIAAVVDYDRPAGGLGRLLLGGFLRLFERRPGARAFLDYDLAGALVARGFADVGTRHGRLAWRMVVARKGTSAAARVGIR